MILIDNNVILLAFTAESGINGTISFEGVKYQLTVLNLPAVTECYKSYDDVNLVKSGDVGQILIVGDLIDDEATTGETKDGITPPMRNARQRVFREPISVSKETVKKVEEQLFAILDGGAPKGFRYRDYEEIWMIDEKTGKGKWVPANGS
eukprot:jgi/Picsp_1/5992/NSC_03347-R1_tbp-associated factor 7